MPANVIRFSSFHSLNPKPTQLYCDTNFLIRLLFYHDNKSQPHVLTAKEQDCFKFYDSLSQQGKSEFITSIYGVSELLHFYFFWYGTDAMYNVTNKFFKQKKIPSQGSVHDNYKYFAKTYPSQFNAAFKKIQHRINKVENFLQLLGIKILYPLPSPSLTNITKQIVQRALLLLNAFPKLESNDAMHLAISERLNINHIITLDEAYQDVDGFTIITR